MGDHEEQKLWEEAVPINPRHNLRTDRPAVRLVASQGVGNLNTDFANLLKANRLDHVTVRQNERARRLYLHCTQTPSEGSLKVVFDRHNVPARVSLRGVLRNLGIDFSKSRKFDAKLVEVAGVPSEDKVLYIELDKGKP